MGYVPPVKVIYKSEQIGSIREDGRVQVPFGKQWVGGGKFKILPMGWQALKVRKGAHLTHYIGPANTTNIETDLKDEWTNDELNEDFTSLQNLERYIGYEFEIVRENEVKLWKNKPADIEMEIHEIVDPNEKIKYLGRILIHGGNGNTRYQKKVLPIGWKCGKYHKNRTTIVTQYICPKKYSL